MGKEAYLDLTEIKKEHLQNILHFMYSINVFIFSTIDFYFRNNTVFHLYLSGIKIRKIFTKLKLRKSQLVMP